MSTRAETEVLERQQQERKRQRDHEMEQRALEKAFNNNGELSKGWMREILDTEDLEEYLNEYELDKVRAMINRQWILGKLSEARVHDRWYKLEVMKYKIYGSFPPQESAIQGPVRAFLFDNEKEMLSALTAEQRTAIDQIILSLQNMVTRSEGGFERKQVNTNIARTETDQGDQEETGSGRRFGLF